MRQSDWCEIHTQNDLIGVSNIPLSICYHRSYLKKKQKNKKNLKKGFLFFRAVGIIGDAENINRNVLLWIVHKLIGFTAMCLLSYFH